MLGPDERFILLFLLFPPRFLISPVAFLLKLETRSKEESNEKSRRAEEEKKDTEEMAVGQTTMDGVWSKDRPVKKNPPNIES